ncbi:hypothetical protein BU17DRAFT_72354 [Hysterangium stoloniferum]|nr:hypothetical protein BU17DRAFT_72354 [Hysterangium stoloniferum]
MPSLTGPCEFRDYASSTSASVSLNPPEVMRGFMFGAKGWRSEGTLGSGGEDFMCAAAAGARGPRSNGISLTGSAPVLRSGASMSTAYPHSVSSIVGAEARQAARVRPQQSQLSPQSQSNPSIASSTIEVLAPHRNTNYTSNLDPNLNPTSSDNNDNILVSRHLGKTPFQTLAAAVAIAYLITIPTAIATRTDPFALYTCTDCG